MTSSKNPRSRGRRSGKTKPLGRPPSQGTHPAVSPEEAIQEAQRRYEAEYRERITTFGDALSVLESLRDQLGLLHTQADRSPDDGDYRVACDIAWCIVSQFTLDDTPERPCAKTTMGIEDADDYITDCRNLFLNRERPEYWEWRFGTSPHRSGQGFLEWHLKHMAATWRIAFPGAPHSLHKALEYVDAVEGEFTCFHELWAVGHGENPDYLPVALEGHRITSDTLKLRPAPPSGRHSFANLCGYMNGLRELLSAKPSRAKPADAKDATHAALVVDDIPPSRTLTKRQQERVQQVQTKLDALRQEFLGPSDLNAIGLSRNTVENDWQRNGNPGDRRGGGPALHRVAYRREFVQQFVTERWKPRV